MQRQHQHQTDTKSVEIWMGNSLTRTEGEQTASRVVEEGELEPAEDVRGVFEGAADQTQPPTPEDKVLEEMWTSRFPKPPALETGEDAYGRVRYQEEPAVQEVSFRVVLNCTGSEKKAPSMVAPLSA